MAPVSAPLTSMLMLYFALYFCSIFITLTQYKEFFSSFPKSCFQRDTSSVVKQGLEEHIYLLI